MDKMRMESIDMTEKNIEKIVALFPNCILRRRIRTASRRRPLTLICCGRCCPEM